MTSSLNNFLLSITAGAIVALAILLAVGIVGSRDKIERS